MDVWKYSSRRIYIEAGWFSSNVSYCTTGGNYHGNFIKATAKGVLSSLTDKKCTVCPIIASIVNRRTCVFSTFDFTEDMLILENQRHSILLC